MYSDVYVFPEFFIFYMSLPKKIDFIFMLPWILMETRSNIIRVSLWSHKKYLLAELSSLILNSWKSGFFFFAVRKSSKNSTEKPAQSVPD